MSYVVSYSVPKLTWPWQLLLPHPAWVCLVVVPQEWSRIGWFACDSWCSASWSRSVQISIVSTTYPLVVLTYVFELSGALKCVMIPIQSSQPLMNSWISRPNITNVRLKVLNIDWVEPDNGRVKSNIALGDVFAPIVWPLRGWKVLLNFVQVLEQGNNGFLISSLSSGKAALVNPIIYIIIRPGICFVDLLPEVLWVKYHVPIFLWE